MTEHCHVCFQEGADVTCEQCSQRVHRQCFPGVAAPWTCVVCTRNDLRDCLLCGHAGNTMVETDSGHLVHLSCCVFPSGVTISKENQVVGTSLPEHSTQACYLCHKTHGFQMECKHSRCRRSFHPICALHNVCSLAFINRGRESSFWQGSCHAHTSFGQTLLHFSPRNRPSTEVSRFIQQAINRLFVESHSITEITSDDDSVSSCILVSPAVLGKTQRKCPLASVPEPPHPFFAGACSSKQPSQKRRKAIRKQTPKHEVSLSRDEFLLQEHKARQHDQQWSEQHKSVHSFFTKSFVSTPVPQTDSVATAIPSLQLMEFPLETHIGYTDTRFVPLLIRNSLLHFTIPDKFPQLPIVVSPSSQVLRLAFTESPVALPVPPKPQRKRTTDVFEAISDYFPREFSLPYVQKLMKSFRRKAKGKMDLWTEQFRPDKHKWLLSDTMATTELKLWFDDLDAFDALDDDLFVGPYDDIEIEPRNKAILLSGPNGYGKTTAVQTFAQENGYHIMEINSSTKRTQSYFKSQLMETTQSHCLHGQTGTLNRSLILIHECDTVFQDEVSFLSGLTSLIHSSKVPIVLICNDPQTTRHLVDKHIVFREPRLTQSAVYLYVLVQSQGCLSFATVESMEWLITHYNYDIKRCISFLQYYVASGHHAVANLDEFKFFVMGAHRNMVHDRAQLPYRHERWSERDTLCDLIGHSVCDSSIEQQAELVESASILDALSQSASSPALFYQADLVFSQSSSLSQTFNAVPASHFQSLCSFYSCFFDLSPVQHSVFSSAYRLDYLSTIRAIVSMEQHNTACGSRRASRRKRHYFRNIDPQQFALLHPLGTRD